jgi:cytochrome c2
LAACSGEDDDKDDDNTSVGTNIEGTPQEVTGDTSGIPSINVTEQVVDGSDGNAGNGETLFTNLGCTACHSTATDVAQPGPSLKGVANRAGDRVEGLTAEEYLHQSLLEPTAYVVEGYEAIMPTYDQIPESDRNDVVAFLLTLDE